MSVRVVLVDHNAAHVELLRILLELEDGFDIVGEATDGVVGVTLAAQLKPDLIVADIGLPSLDGLRAVPRFRIAAPEVLVVLMSTRPHADVAAYTAGADLYLDKGTGVDTMIAALRRVCENPPQRGEIAPSA